MSVIAALGIAAGGALAVQSPAAAAVNGTVWCDNGSAVQGVYIDSSAAGRDGWAAWNRFSGDASRATYSRSEVTTSYRVNVGCGGSPSSWQYSIWSGWYSGNLNFICHVTGTATQRYCYPS